MTHRSAPHIVLIALVGLLACAIYRTREFVPSEGPASYENWTVEPRVWAFKGSRGASTLDHSFSVSVSVHTYSGDSGGHYRESAYSAEVESIEFVLHRGSSEVPLQLGSLKRGTPADPTVSSYVAAERPVHIPAEVDRLTAIANVAFVNRSTSAQLTRRFAIPMHRNEQWRPGVLVD